MYDETLLPTDGSAAVETAVREGVLYETIIDYADENGVALLVMSSHGQSGGEPVRLRKRHRAGRPSQ